ncbi:MAG TPA: GNAT family N-acetyltransferase [Aggregatilineales bacterium]|nr:GNAT family N-acetyltransferase [Aggregatilineales bacterium]
MSINEPIFTIRPLLSSDRNWVAHFLDEYWRSTKIVSRGIAYYAHLLPGFVAEMNNAPDDAPPAGLITYHIEGRNCQIITINSLQQNIGVGTKLLEAAKQVAIEAGCKRMWLITTNDNLEALRFYQKRAFHLVAVYPNALAETRKLKPQLPIMGKDDIPLRDEIELEILL